jgi:hypothetical protein
MGAGIVVGVVYGRLIGHGHGSIFFSVIVLMEIFGVRTAWGQCIEQAH